MKAIYYIESTGRITKCIEAIEDIILANKTPEESIIEGYVDNVDNYKVVEGVVVNKHPLPITITGTTITGIPEHTYVTINLQAPVEINDGVLELDATYNQVVLVYLYNVDYLPQTVQVSV